MDELEIEIGRLSNLKMVHFYDLISRGDNVGAIAVYDDEERKINLCVLDAHYDKLLEKVVTCYREQEDRAQIIMDEETRHILEQMVQDAPVPETRSFWGDVPGATLYDLPILDTSSYPDRMVLPLLRYYVKELHALFDVPIEWKLLTGSWHGRGMLAGSANARAIRMPYRIQRRKGCEYEILLGNYLGKTHRLQIRVLFERMGLRTYFMCPSVELTGYSTYTLSASKKTVTGKTSISVGNKTIYEQKEELPALEGDEKETLLRKVLEDGISELLTEDPERATVVAFPWDHYLVYTLTDRDDDSMLKQDAEVGYLVVNEKYDILRKYSFSHIIGRTNKVEMDARYACGDVVLQKGKDKLLQIAFEDTGYSSSGDYKERFSGRYLVKEIG